MKHNSTKKSTLKCQNILHKKKLDIGTEGKNREKAQRKGHFNPGVGVIDSIYLDISDNHINLLILSVIFGIFVCSLFVTLDYH